MKITIEFNEAAQREFERLCEILGTDKVNTIRYALTICTMIAEEEQGGSNFLVVREDGEPEKIRVSPRVLSSDPFQED